MKNPASPQKDAQVPGQPQVKDDVRLFVQKWLRNLAQEKATENGESKPLSAERLAHELASRPPGHKGKSLTGVTMRKALEKAELGTQVVHEVERYTGRAIHDLMSGSAEVQRTERPREVVLHPNIELWLAQAVASKKWTQEEANAAAIDLRYFQGDPTRQQVIDALQVAREGADMMGKMTPSANQGERRDRLRTKKKAE